MKSARTPLAAAASRGPARTLARLLFSAYAMILVAVVVFKLPFHAGASGGPRVINLIPFLGSFDHNGQFLSSEIVFNTLLFMPLGVYVSALTTWSTTKRILAVVGSSLTLEATQFVFAICIADVTDLIDSSVGGIVGIGLHAVLSKACREQTLRVINTASIALLVLVLPRFAQVLINSHTMVGPPPNPPPS
ncbi:MAG: VanZ family protein [Bifidobacteriaceae bacterium]|nr:VanZ family protein [Bifidobacteriaceae bacterium]